MKDKIFAAVLFLIGISAVAGGYGLIFMNGLGMPISRLETSPFTSYFWPGMILLFVVGGTHLLAAKLVWGGNRFMHEALATAGFGMLIWIFVEMYIVQERHFLQVMYFGIGMATLIITILLLKYEKEI